MGSTQITTPHPNPTPEGGLLVSGAWRTLAGVSVGSESWVHTPEPVLHAFQNEEKMLIVTALEERGGLTSPRISPNRYYKSQQRRAINFVCAGMPLWGYSDTVTFIRDAVLLFDTRTAERILGDELDRSLLQMPQLCHQNSKLFTLLGLVADAITVEDESSTLYGEGLICSILSLVLGKRGEASKSGSRATLTAWQVERTKDCIYSQFPERVDIEKLAKLVELSPSHFARAFKNSVGVAPYQFQLEARVNEAKRLMKESGTPIDEAAHRTGFVDRAHFNRVFRKVTGETPAAWKKLRP